MVTKQEKKVRLKKLKKESLQRKKAVLQADIARQKLLQAVAGKKRVSVLARVEDRIPNVLVKKRDEEIKPMFLGKGRLL